MKCITSRHPTGERWSVVYRARGGRRPQLWICATGWRGDQARTVASQLEESEPAVVGADLNTWLGARWESAYRRFARVWPVPPAASIGSARDAHGRLDYVFFRLPAGRTKDSRRLDRHFGSDHRPIISGLRFP